VKRNLTPVASLCYITQAKVSGNESGKDLLVPKIVIDETRCKGCALCTIACPRKLLRLSEKINRSGFLPVEKSADCERDCTSCALCAQMCPDVAISVYRQEKAK
jgi:2-oxoglutarate ferredoxin oxidoreductase subunit delta